jgi:E3 ubiquitin-protein ligase HUWE1
VDPSFLAALPENIRQEVIADQVRLQRQRLAAREQQQSRGGQAGTTASSSTADASVASASAMAAAEISPEFLAALPPSIQEEVLAEQRLQRAATNIDPDAPHQFIQTLPPLLRRQVLADMDDSQIAVLPEQLATEAQALRNELEQRQRQVQERFFTTHAGSTLSRILRSAGTLSHGSIHRMHATLFADSASGGRIGSGTRYAIQTMAGGASHWPWSMSGSRGGASGANSMQNAASTYRPGMAKFKGRQLLDHEALSCLLILLFVDEPKLNIGRLHRVLRNLSQHPTTRQWVIQSLLTIMERTRENRELEVSRTRKGSSTSQKYVLSHFFTDFCFPMMRKTLLN